jgi:MFS family permease
MQQLKTLYHSIFTNTDNRSRAVRFVVLIGIVSLFTDITYQGARSINGAYLATLGASALMVGVIAGASEFVGYALRLVSGYWAHKTQQYWLIALMGYAINLVAVPLMALANHWWIAACLIILERFGKAIRTPARDTLLANSGQQLGMGWAFGLHQALDQTGAMLGPMIVAFVLYFSGGYQEAYAWLGVPALFALWILIVARKTYAGSVDDMQPDENPTHNKILNKKFVWYLMGTGLLAAGYADFPLIAFHFEKTNILSKEMVPLAYGFAMGLDIIWAPVLGKLYDKWRTAITLAAFSFSALFAPLVFLGGSVSAFLGILIWGMGMGAQSALLRAVVGDLVSANNRAFAYGIFNMVFGICWFAGSALIGLLYEISISWMVIFIVSLELLALPWLFKTLHTKSV